MHIHIHGDDEEERPCVRFRRRFVYHTLFFLFPPLLENHKFRAGDIARSENIKLEKCSVISSSKPLTRKDEKKKDDISYFPK